MSSVETVEFPRPVTERGHPDPYLLEITRDRPILPVVGPGGVRGWLVSTDELAREVLSEPARFSNMIDPKSTNSRAGMVLLDPPDHTRLRRLAMQAFTPRRVRALVPDIERMVATLLDELERKGRPLDLVRSLALPLPAKLMSTVLGVPDDQQEQLQEWADIFTAMTAYTSERIMSAVDSMYEYMHRLVGERSQALGTDDVLSHLIRARDGADALTEDELVATLVLLFVAGNETAAKAISRGVMVLTTTGQWDRLVAGEVSPEQVVEEVLRHQTPIDTALFRWAKVNTELGGATIKAGEQVFVSLHLANFDTSVRQDPEVFDPGREAAPHLAFGFGAHYCLGAPLARAKLAVTFRQLAARFPTLRLACELEDLTWTAGSMLNSPVSLPVTW